MVVWDFFHQQIAPRWNTAVGRWDSSIRKASQVPGANNPGLHRTTSLTPRGVVSLELEKSFQKGNPSLPWKTCWDWIFVVAWNFASYHEWILHEPEDLYNNYYSISKNRLCSNLLMIQNLIHVSGPSWKPRLRYKGWIIPILVFTRQLWHRNWI